MFTSPVLKSALLIALTFSSATAFAAKCDDECVRKLNEKISLLQTSDASSKDAISDLQKAVAALQAQPAGSAEASGARVPVGAIIAVASNNPPAGGYIEANGAEVNDLTDPRNLKELCGQLRGKFLVQGDSSSTCRMPNLSGRTIIGAGTGIANPAGTARLTQRKFGEQVGEENHVLTEAELAPHSHTATDQGHAHETSAATEHDSANGTHYVPSNGRYIKQMLTTIGYARVTIGSAGQGQAHNIMQPSLTLKYWIKY